MKLKEKISLEKVFEKEYKIKLVEPENNKEAVITHFLHNNKNGISKFYKKDAVNFTKEILQYKYPQEEITNVVAEEALQYGIFDTFEIPFPPVENPKFKFIDLFAGIGGFRNDFDVPIGPAFQSNLFDCSLQKGFPLQFLT